MKCTRCNTEVFVVGSHEAKNIVMCCNFCGQYTAKYSEFNDPSIGEIVREISNSPMGVVVTPEGNYSYHSLWGRNDLLKRFKCSGYTCFHQGEWQYFCYTKKRWFKAKTVAHEII